jgi:hypothetical protein
MKLTEASTELLRLLSEDANNWGGTPAYGQNVHSNHERNGSLTDLKKKGLLATDDEIINGERIVWVHFTATGRKFIKDTFSVEIEHYG